jgi:hypothetical protein
MKQKINIRIAAITILLLPGISWNTEARFKQEPMESAINRESRFKNTFTENGMEESGTNSPSAEGGITPPGDPTAGKGQGEEEDTAPVGNALPFVLGMSLLYGGCLLVRKNRKTINKLLYYSLNNHSLNN